MSEDIQGASPDSGAGPAPQETSGQSSPQTEANEKVLHALSKQDNADDFVAEKRDQEAAKRGDSEIDAPHKRNERLERYKRADKILSEEGSAFPPQADTATEQPQPQLDERQIRREAEFNVRAKQYINENPTAQSEIRATFAVYEPAEHVADLLLESDIGPALAHELTKAPEAIMELNELSPAAAARWLGMIEGKIRTAKQYEQQPIAPARKQTNAPRPMQTVKGGAVARTDIHALAKRDDASDYIAARNRQEAARR